MQVVEDREEGDAEEETEGAAEVGHLQINQQTHFGLVLLFNHIMYQGGERVYEVFCLNIGFLRHCPHWEGDEVPRFENL